MVQQLYGEKIFRNGLLRSRNLNLMHSVKNTEFSQSTWEIVLIFLSKHPTILENFDAPFRH